MVATNTYNALGQRVRDVTQTNTTDEAYGAGGELLWRYTGSSSDPNQRAFVPFGGGILAEYYSGGTLFDHPDELGSVTASTSYNGAMCQERLFYPFGELWTGAGNCGMHQTFGKLPDYDAETDQYNTLNRHYSPSGRWLSPDPGGPKVVKLDDPQTWNMYAYVRNNPTTLTDPTGLTPPSNGIAAPKGVKVCMPGDPESCAPERAISGDTKGGPDATQVQTELTNLATAYRLPVPLVLAVAKTESSFNVSAQNQNIDNQTGKVTSTDYGLMQVNSRHLGETYAGADGKSLAITASIETDWKANANAGVAILAHAYKVALADLGKTATAQEMAQRTYPVTMPA
jgi:RHS repeat-associated protein